MFDFAIDSKLRGCDVVKVRIGEVVSGGHVRSRPTVVQQELAGRFSSSCLSRLAPASSLGSSTGTARWTSSCSPAGRITSDTSAPASMPASSTSGSAESVASALVVEIRSP